MTHKLTAIGFAFTIAAVIAGGTAHAATGTHGGSNHSHGHHDSGSNPPPAPAQVDPSPLAQQGDGGDQGGLGSGSGGVGDVGAWPVPYGPVPCNWSVEYQDCTS